MSLLASFLRCLRCGVGPGPWAAVFLTGFVLLALNLTSRAEHSGSAVPLVVSWLPLLPILVSGMAMLASWPAFSPAQAAYRSLWLLRAPISGLRGAAWLGSAVALAALLLVGGVLIAAFLNLEGHSGFARSQRLRFARVAGSDAWLGQPGLFQELRIPRCDDARRIHFEPRYLTNLGLAGAWRPLRFDLIAQPLDSTRSVPLGIHELKFSGSELTVELPETLATPCAVRIVARTEAAGVAPSFANGRATLERGRLSLLQAMLEWCLRFLPWGAMALAVAALVGRFAPEAFQVPGWLLVLPALGSMQGLGLPDFDRGLRLGHVPILAELEWTPLALGLAALLLAQLPGRPQHEAQGAGRR